MLSSGIASIQELEEKASGSMSGTSSNATNETKKMEEELKNSFQTMLAAVNTSMNSTGSSTQAGFSRITRQVISSMSQTHSQIQISMNQIQQTISSDINAVSHTFQSEIIQLFQVSIQVSSQIVSVSSSLSSQLDTLGYNAGMGLASGLPSSTGAIYSTTSIIANSVARTIRSALGAHSPSKITTQMEEMLGKGSGLGMQSTFSFVEKQVNEPGPIIQAQCYQAEAVMVGDAAFTDKNTHTFADKMDQDAVESELRQEKIHIYNEVIGDKIYTTVKRKEAPEKSRNNYFS